MDPLKLVETGPGQYSLLLDAGSTPADRVVADLGREPHGYFWDAMAKWLIRTRVPAVEGRVRFDPEGGMFCAYGTDREALTLLGAALAAVANAPEQVPTLIEEAEKAGVDFDD
jgi:hypothetical protein